jgi:hypothetical protein
MKLNHASGPRQQFSPQRRSALLEQFDRSQVAAADFAAQHGVGVSTLYAWRRRAVGPRRPKTTVEPPQATFQSIPLGQVLGVAGAWAGEVSLPDGTQLRWNPQLSIATLQELLAHLRRPC